MELDDIPAELKWKIAIKTFQSFFSGYGAAFRQILDEKTVKNVEEIVWAERGKEVKKNSPYFEITFRKCNRCQ